MAYSLQFGPQLSLPDGTLGPVAWQREVTVPDSIKRPYPDDLFASSTPRTVIESSQVNVLYPQLVYGGDTHWGFLSSGREASFEWTNEMNECRMKLAAKIKDQNVNLAQAMIEFRQTASLFLTLSQELYHGYRDIRRGDFRGAVRSADKLKLISTKWIEYQFGLLPLVSDMQGLCDSLALGLRDGIQLQATQSVNGRQQNYRRILRDPIGNSYLEHIESETFSVRMKARYMIRDTSVKDVSRFGFFNVPALLWELVPFSFVVDWAIPVGNWLSSLDALHGVYELVYIQGTKKEWSSQRTSSNGGPTASSRYIEKTRSQSLTGLPLNFPAYQPSTSLKKIATGLALLTIIHNTKR